MSPKALLVVLSVVAAGGAVVVIHANNTKVPKSISPAHTGPPPDAIYLDDGPSTIIMTVGGSKGAARDSALDSFVGKWNGAGGWQGAVESITTHRGQAALRLIEYDATILGGSYTIIAVVGEGHGTEKGKTVHVQGRVADVIVKPMPAGVANQIVLEDARIVK